MLSCKAVSNRPFEGHSCGVRISSSGAGGSGSLATSLNVIGSVCFPDSCDVGHAAWTAAIRASFSDPESRQVRLLHRRFAARIGSDVKRATIICGSRVVLTIFEYLRRRASESILEGVQDAVAALEKGVPQSQVNPSRGTGTPAGTGLPGPSHKPGEPPSADATPATNGSNFQGLLAGLAPAENSQKPGLPPPRRRGRPRNEERSA